MTERPTAEAKTYLTSSAPRKLFLNWRLDPKTGKPVARWTIERPSLPLRIAA